MPAGTNRKMETRTAPAPGSCRTAPTTDRQKATTTEPTLGKLHRATTRFLIGRSTIGLMCRPANLRCCTALTGVSSRYRVGAHAVFRRSTRRAPAPGSAGATTTVLFYDIGADFAGRRVLIAGTAAATDRANQLAVFHKRKSTGACY